MQKWRTIIFFLPVAVMTAQTQVDLRTQSKSVDFSGAVATKPAKAGTTLPANCSTGEVFFKLDASAGQNLYLCAAVNTWTQLTSGSGGGSTPTSTSALTDLIVAKTGPTTLSIAGSCSANAPCNVRFGGRTIGIPSSATATVPTGANVAGTAFIYISSQGLVTVGNTMGVTCSNCTAVDGVTQFPSDSIPLFTWVATSGSWASNGGVDLRAFLSNKSVIAGTGIVTADAAGQTVVSADTSVVGVRVAAPTTAADSCVQGTYAVDASFFYQCIASNTWRRVAIAVW